MFHVEHFKAMNTKNEILGQNDQIRVKNVRNTITVEQIETGEEESWDMVINFRAVGEYELSPKDMKLIYSVDGQVAEIMES